MDTIQNNSLTDPTKETWLVDSVISDYMHDIILADVPVKYGSPVVIASVDFEEDDRYDPVVGFRAANARARLMAAAPVMYRALLAAKAFGSQGATHEGISVSYLIDEALKAANGGT